MSGSQSGRCPECDRLLLYRGECAGCGYVEDDDD
jgi:hypothetical protein